MRLSDKLKGYQGLNPFRDSQSKMYGDEKIAAEFSPTTTFWSLFNEQHEILLGSRGSGKTVLLRMLSFSCLRQYAEKNGDPAAVEYVRNKRFIGFYIPMHLEFAAGLPDGSASEEEGVAYFQFAFNCMAAQSLLDQVGSLLIVAENDSKERLRQLSAVLATFQKWWFPSCNVSFSSLDDVRETIMHLYSVLGPSDISGCEDASQFAKPLLRPILHVLPVITKDLQIDTDNTRWLACIDEAEFLHPKYIECINTFLRDEKRPLVVKMATLPFRHSTRCTLHDGVEIESNGSDFNYRCIDMGCSSDDFENVTDHITRVRLQRTGLNDLDDEHVTLAAFVGTVGRDEPLDYFRQEMESTYGEWDEDNVINDIVAELGAARQAHYERVRNEPQKFIQPVLKKFRPIYFVRKMKAERSQGNRWVGWFAGAENIRHVADGNPRTFIQLMNALVDASRGRDLTPKNQHRVLMQFCERRHEASEGLPEHGVTAKALIDVIGRLLEDRVHGTDMVDSGCHFRVSSELLEDAVVREALAVATGYTHILVDLSSLLESLSPQTDFRLSYCYCVAFWLPMRRGQSRLVGQRERRLFSGEQLAPSPPVTANEAHELVRQLRLEFTDDEAAITLEID